MNSQVEESIQKSSMFNDLLPRALCVFWFVPNLVLLMWGWGGRGGGEHEMIFAGPGKNHF